MGSDLREGQVNYDGCGNIRFVVIKKNKHKFLQQMVLDNLGHCRQLSAFKRVLGHDRQIDNYVCVLRHTSHEKPLKW